VRIICSDITASHKGRSGVCPVLIITHEPHRSSVRLKRNPVIMTKSFFMSSIFLVVLVTPGFCEKATVCKEEDGDIRVDCLIPPEKNKASSYQFSISKGSKETVINTNITGSSADPSFKTNTKVELLDSQGYRLRLSNYQLTEDTTFSCVASEKNAKQVVEKGKMLACSAISVFFHNCPWLLSMLLFFHVTQSWALSAH
ncbi:hypothetical protein GJAV_G00132660, partial [Gymnothorax javanicus]